MKRLFSFSLALLLLISTAIAAEEMAPFETSGWAHEDVVRAADLDLIYNPASVTDTREPITRADFAANTASLVATKFGSNLKSYVLIARYRGQAERDEYFLFTAFDVAKRLGIIQGRENGYEDPSAFITRQEAAVMLARAYRAYQDTAPNALEPLSFADRDDIADWALEDVKLMNQLGVMTGVGEGRFDPLGSYTIEQCLVSLVRLYEKVPFGDSKQQNPFTIAKLEEGFFRTWEEPYDIAFAIETEDYFICALDRATTGTGLGYSCYEIKIIDQNLSLWSYETPILTHSDIYRGAEHTRPENPSLSADGTKLFYTATLEEDTYHIFGLEEADKTLLFPKGVYSVTMDLATGEQAWTRANLE